MYFWIMRSYLCGVFVSFKIFYGWVRKKWLDSTLMFQVNLCADFGNLVNAVLACELKQNENLWWKAGNRTYFAAYVTICSLDRIPVFFFYFVFFGFQVFIWLSGSFWRFLFFLHFIFSNVGRFVTRFIVNFSIIQRFLHRLTISCTCFQRCRISRISTLSIFKT